jgi:hypothetical protein
MQDCHQKPKGPERSTTTFLKSERKSKIQYPMRILLRNEWGNQNCLSWRKKRIGHEQIYPKRKTKGLYLESKLILKKRKGILEYKNWRRERSKNMGRKTDFLSWVLSIMFASWKKNNTLLGDSQYIFKIIMS